jgi:hypothetical protein
MGTDRQDMTRQAADAGPPDRSIVGLLRRSWQSKSSRPRSLKRSPCEGTAKRAAAVGG